MRTEKSSHHPSRVRFALVVSGLLAAGAAAPAAGAADRSLARAPLLPGAEITHLTRAVARAELGRDLFRDPAGATLVGRVEVFDRYPFVRARYVQLVTDAAWNRILFGEPGGAIHVFDGAGTALGPLRGPAGIDRDPDGRIFVADELNRRVVVLALRGDGADLRLEPEFAITGFERPAGVAWDGGTTPLDASDDLLWVVDAGAHRIAGYRLGRTGATLFAAFGTRGNGSGQFLAPRDIEVGRQDGVHTPDLYVADWGNGRIVHLERDGAGIGWIDAQNVGPDVRSVATDAWGNVYAALRGAGRIVKLDRELAPVIATERAAFPGVRDLAVGFLTITDHRHGTRSFAGYGSLHVLEDWDEASGASRLTLGVEARELAAEPAGGGAAVRFLLTDHAEVDVRVTAAGRVVRRAALGRVAAGRREWIWDGRDESGAPVRDGVAFELEARSLYADGGVAHAAVGLGEPGAPEARMAVAGAWPNPLRAGDGATAIRFFVPAATSTLALDVVDVSGRLRHRLAAGDALPGQHVVHWDGTTGGGERLSSGVYFLTLRADGETAPSHKLVILR